MQAGKIRHLVSLQVNSPTRSSTSGEEIAAWSELAPAWASIEPLQGRELFAAQQINAEVTHKVCLRYAGSAPVTPTMRVRFGARNFDILAARNLEERDRELELLCKERA